MYNCINKSGWSFRGNGPKKMHKENKTGRPEGGLIVSCVIFRLTAMEETRTQDLDSYSKFRLNVFRL